MGVRPTMTGMAEMTVCEACAERVDLKDSSLVHARVAEDASWDQNGERPGEIDTGPDALFHPWCFPADSPIWRRRA